jgi:hypothetical protein
MGISVAIRPTNSPEHNRCSVLVDPLHVRWARFAKMFCTIVWQPWQHNSLVLAAHIFCPICLATCDDGCPWYQTLFTDLPLSSSLAVFHVGHDCGSQPSPTSKQRIPQNRLGQKLSPPVEPVATPSLHLFPACALTDFLKHDQDFLSS